MAGSRKEIAQQFLKMCAMGQVREGYDAFVAPDFVHHNAWFPGDRASLMKGMEDSHREMPSKSFEPRNVLEDGDLVAVHSRLCRGKGEPDISVVHTLRFAGSKIAEMWDVGMVLPHDSPNKNGAF